MRCRHCVIDNLAIIDLPWEGEEAIAAMIWPTEYKILINENSDRLSKGFQESSIAHEIGH